MYSTAVGHSNLENLNVLVFFFYARKGSNFVLYCQAIFHAPFWRPEGTGHTTVLYMYTVYMYVSVIVNIVSNCLHVQHFKTNQNRSQVKLCVFILLYLF